MEMELRSFDPAIARWVVIDPVTHHSLSPYNAFDNNPIYWADPSGADAEGIKVHNSNHVTFTGAAAQDAAAILGINGGGDECDDCKEGETKPEMVNIPRVGIAPHKTKKQYYHAGGVNDSEAGWYSQERYAEIIRPVAENLAKYLGGWKFGSIEISGSYDAYLSFISSEWLSFSLNIKLSLCGLKLESSVKSLVSSINLG